MTNPKSSFSSILLRSKPPRRRRTPRRTDTTTSYPFTDRESTRPSLPTFRFCPLDLSLSRGLQSYRLPALQRIIVLLPLCTLHAAVTQNNDPRISSSITKHHYNYIRLVLSHQETIVNHLSLEYSTEHSYRFGYTPNGNARNTASILILLILLR